MSMGAGMALGCGISMAITLILSATTAYLAEMGRIPINGIGYCAMIILFLSTIAGAIIAQKKIQRLRLQVCLSLGGLYYLLLVCTTLLLFGGNFTGMGATALVIVCGSLLSALATNRQGRRKPRKFKPKIAM